MDTNVKIILSDGNILDAVGISYLHIDALNKDYIFYSLNELANGNMDKIYIAEASQNGTAPGPLSDDEWYSIKQIMLNISHNEPVSGITYKPLNGLTFNVGEAKKLAIKGDKKQAFIDAQNKAIAPTIAADEPAFVSDQAANGSPFFDTSAQANTTNVVQETTVQSAFNMQPPVEQEIQVESLESETTPNDIIQPVQEQPVVENTIIDTTVPVMEATVVEDTPTMVEAPAVEAPVVNNLEMPKVDNIGSIEDLEAAINDLQSGIDKIKSYIASLKEKNTVVVNTTQVQTIATGQTPVATEVMNIAEQPEIVTDTLAEEKVLSNVVDNTVQIEPLDNPVVTSVIDTSIDTNVNAVLDTSVSAAIDESVNVSPVVNQPIEEVGEPAFSIDQNVVAQPQTIVLDSNAIPAPNSANSINTSTVEMSIPEAPVIDTSVPQIPISPLEQNGVPEVAPIPTPVIEQPVVSAPSAVEQVIPVQPVEQVQPVEPVAPVAPVVEQTVQSVPEINVAPVQQVPTVDLSAINTNVTLPTDMTANPTPSGTQEGLLGPASLDVESEQ